MTNYQELVTLLQAHNFNIECLGEEQSSHILPENWDSDDVAFDIVIENQRGLKLLGSPLFSRKLLFPFFDPPPFQRLDGRALSLLLDRIDNYPLPDLGWYWGWQKWYVLMLNDVDELGWMYLLIFLRVSQSWHGKYYMGDFVRRRLWIRMRLQEKEGKENKFLS